MSDRLTVGVVLAGGSSTRMGVDKASLPVDGTPMALRVAHTLQAAGCQPVEFQGGDGVQFAESAIETHADQWPARGPIVALAEALARHPEAHVVSAACDLVDLDETTVAALIQAGSGDTTVDVAVASTDGARHLLCWWRAGSGVRLGELVENGTSSFRGALEQMRVADVEVDPAAVRNINTPGDLDDRG